ncbi:transposase [Erwinia amylovora]|uniref:transposase n=1 Tax=Erwinia amylovora TaxID=552 RepID=UPI0030CA4F52
MGKARFTEHPIIAVLKSVEAGRTAKDVCREDGFSYASFVFRWWAPVEKGHVRQKAFSSGSAVSTCRAVSAIWASIFIEHNKPY